MCRAAAPHHRKRRRGYSDDSDYSSARRRISGIIGPSNFPPVRSFGIRFALANAPYHCCKRRLHDACRPASTPTPRRRLRRRRGSSRSSIISLHLPFIRPFSLRYFLATGASAPRRRRKSAAADMGNYISCLFGKSSSDGGEEDDLSVTAMVNAVRRGTDDADIAALEASAPPEKRAPYHNEVFARMNSRHDGRLESIATDRKLQRLRKALLVPADRPKEDMSELFTPLTNEEESEVNSILYGCSHSKKIIVMHVPSNTEITKEKLWCLRTCGWLNDEVINLYLELLKERAEREPQRFLKCHFFNTFFYKKLACGKIGYDYQSVRRWTTLNKLGYGLAECEKVIFLLLLAFLCFSGASGIQNL
ncbi:hypothetical protein GUJ93_ZPchr0007g5720 [Zizania palustris]|uniref:Ubiquitin-like protease family profile domain-containing protein n=2 Tax=Zizania palustris TaxID=103762 RepID=A0A8J5ST13_ZIZPA|nr:hypothetical protein GUJ93_ZPchr0007g5720 [Zizania palustris]